MIENLQIMKNSRAGFATENLAYIRSSEGLADIHLSVKTHPATFSSPSLVLDIPKNATGFKHSKVVVWCLVWKKVLSIKT